MGVAAYRILYHEAVVSEDLSLITKSWKIKIKDAIDTKLTVDPIAYGKPLRRSLHGYRKLRVGDFRVIFRVEDSIVKVLIVKHRRIVYERIGGRL